MPDRPTLANLLTQWSSGGPPARRSVYAHLREHPTEAAAVEAFFRDDLRSSLPWKRVIAAEAVLAVFGDEPAAAAALAWALGQGEPAAGADALGVLEKLSPGHAAPLLADFALREPTDFAAQTPDFHRWAGAVLARRPENWTTVFDHAAVETESPLLMGLADAAHGAQEELAPLVPWVKSRLYHDGPGYAAGAALWRITWRVNRDWLESINPHSPRLDNNAALLVLLTEVVGEHLGRRPALAHLARELLVRLAGDAPEKFSPAVARFARLGGRGWAVLLPLLGAAAASAAARAVVFEEAARHPTAARLAHHHAHRSIRARPVESAPLIRAAGEVLAAVGAGAGFALPDLLDLLADQPSSATSVTLAVLAVAPGHPCARAVVARTLDRLRQFEAFASLARVFSWINLDGAPELVEDTGLGLGTVEALLREGPWAGAPADVRLRHAGLLANRLGSPRPEVRERAARCLSHYADQLPNVWPALVAVLLGKDDATARLVFPLFAALKTSADVGEELRELLSEPNPAYAARAVVARWHLGSVPAEAAERCQNVLSDASGAWNWTVPSAAVAAVVESQRPANGFGADSERVTAHARGLLFAEDSPEEAVISARVHPNWPPRVDWDHVHGCVGEDPEGPMLFLALMCAFGSSGFGQKVWLIKHQRGIARTGLGEAKAIVEYAMARLGPHAPPDEKQKCVRDFFGIGATLPLLVTGALNHRMSWYRWAALELIDAWGAPELVPELSGDRKWDRSELVRRRALRMVNR